MKKKMKIDAGDFGSLVIAAVRYCHGRQTYMPTLIQRIVIENLESISDRDLRTLIEDCNYQESCNLYGDDQIDKPSWLAYRDNLNKEQERRWLK